MIRDIVLLVICTGKPVQMDR